MSANKTTREYIDCAAGKNDKIEIVGYDFINYLEKQARNEKPNKNNSKIIASNTFKRVLSTGLELGMSIPAVTTKNKQQSSGKEHGE